VIAHGERDSISNTFGFGRFDRSFRLRQAPKGGYLPIIVALTDGLLRLPTLDTYVQDPVYAPTRPSHSCMLPKDFIKAQRTEQDAASAAPYLKAAHCRHCCHAVSVVNYG